MAEETRCYKRDGLLRLPLQFFAEGGADGAGADGGNVGAGTSDTPTDGQQQANQQEDNKANSTESLDKYVQSKVDKAMADERKKTAELQKQLDKMKREKMSDDEIKQHEISEKEKALAEKEKALAEQQNRLYAIKAIQTAGLDDGSNALELVDFVLSESEEATDNKVKAFKTLVDKMVAAQVDKTFKANGRVPNGASGGTKDDKQNPENNIAVQLGKVRAEQAKKSNDILNYYTTGGKK